MFEGRRVDESSHTPNVHWMDGFVESSKKAAKLNILLGTNDVLPVEESDILVCMSQQEPGSINQLKLRHPNLKTILVLFETSLGARYTYNPRNHQEFDAVVTYNSRLIDHQRYFPLPPRAYYRHRIVSGMPFSQRKVGCLVGTNRPMVYRSGIFTMKKGWHFSWKDWADYIFCPGELITYRSKVGKACAQYPGGIFDIFGEGWELLEETRNKCLGIPKVSVLQYAGNYRYYMAFENHTGEHSLISERIWDALWGDSVPVYYGNKRLHQYIPRECFVDASNFGSPREMLEWLTNAPEEVWERYRKAGRDFIHSAQVERFLPEAFAEAFLRPILKFALVASSENGVNRT